MRQRAGTFETEVRSTLAALNADVGNFPNLAFYPVLADRFARWEPNLEKLAQLENELSQVAVESRDPAEWKQALQGMLKTVVFLYKAFAPYRLAARNQTTDLADHYKALVEAMTAVEEKLVEIGPRLLYTFNDRQELLWLFEHVPHRFTQCAGSLFYWQRHARSPKRTAEERSLPSAFRDARKCVRRLGDLVYDALGEPNLVELRDIKPQPEPLTATDLLILRALVNSQCSLVQTEIVEQVKKMSRKLGRGTVGKRLKVLVRDGLVHYPHGPMKGAVPTDRGRELVAGTATER